MHLGTCEKPTVYVSSYLLHLKLKSVVIIIRLSTLQIYNLYIATSDSMQAILPEDFNQFDTLNLGYTRVESIIIAPVPCLKTVHVIDCQLYYRLCYDGGSKTYQSRHKSDCRHYMKKKKRILEQSQSYVPYTFG